MVRYLVDTSVWMRSRQQVVIQRLARIDPQDTCLCFPVLLEIGLTARNGPDHARLLHTYRAATQHYYLTPAIEDRAIDVQGLLAARGHHRSARLSDLLIAAVAEANDLTVLHYDGDFDLVAAETGQPTQWVTPRGTID